MVDKRQNIYKVPSSSGLWLVILGVAKLYLKYLLRKLENVFIDFINIEWIEKDAYKICVKYKELQYSEHLCLHYPA